MTLKDPQAQSLEIAFVEKLRIADFNKIIRIVLLGVVPILYVMAALIHFLNNGFEEWYFVQCLSIAVSLLFGSASYSKFFYMKPELVFSGLSLTLLGFFIVNFEVAKPHNPFFIHSIVTSCFLASILPWKPKGYLIFMVLYFGIYLYAIYIESTPTSQNLSPLIPYFQLYMLMIVLAYAVLRLVRNALYEKTLQLNKLSLSQELRLEEASRKIAKAQIDAKISGMVQMIAHDFKKPLSMFKIGMDMLEQANTPAEVEKIKSHMKKDLDIALGSAETMLQELLQSGEPTSGEHLSEEFDLLSLTAEAVSALKSSSAGDQRLEFASCGSLYIRGDREKIRRCLLNLIHNALEATPTTTKPVSIRLDLAENENKAIVAIENSVASGDQLCDFSKIFMPFYTKGKKRGTGLGLAIVKSIVEAHSGSITCCHFPDKKTVKFEMALPLSERGLNQSEHQPFRLTDSFKAVAAKISNPVMPVSIH